MPHITLRAIANNSEIDVIWEEAQNELEPLREELNRIIGKWWEEWEIPRNSEETWADEAKELHAAWWERRIARQKEIDASIAAKADYEYLYDKPYEDRGKVRVAGPFTVESISPHRVLGVDENGDVIDGVAEPKAKYGNGYDFGQAILENLKTSGVQQAHKEDRIQFTSLTPWPGRLVGAEGIYVEGSEEDGIGRRAAIFIGPEFGTVSRPDLVEAAREAADGGFDVLIACAFNYEAHTTEFENLGRVPVLKARMNADLHMADDLKNTGKGNLFVIFGEPDIDILEPGDDQIQVKVNGVDVFPPQHRGGEQRRTGWHRLLVHRHRLQRRGVLRPPRILPGGQRPVQVAEDHAQGRNRCRRMGDAPQRHVPVIPQAGVGPHRRQGHQPLGRRGTEGIQGGVISVHGTTPYIMIESHSVLHEQAIPSDCKDV